MIWGLLIAGAAWALWWYQAGQRLTPDGKYYLTLAAGHPVPRPYCGRVLLPLLLGERPWAWRALSGAALVGCGPLVVWYARLRGLGPQDATWAAVLLVGLPGIWALGVRYPVLGDQAALAGALGAACLVLSGSLWWGLIVAALAGLIHERAPVFAALYAAEPLLLLAAVPAIASHLLARPGGETPPWCAHPLTSARKAHAGAWTDPRRVLLPWGALVLLIWYAPSLPARAWPGVLLAAAAVGYAQLLIASDETRLYQWAAPPLIVALLVVVPTAWLPALAVAHVLNPFAAGVEV